MDATPSPQSVGREFVRQYYTLLNKAPDHLHRFYNNHSSFVHGGLDPHNREATMVIGQKQIYNKIQQLRFHDCHAKISQVDAQSTLGNGVVVQVTGELSNDGEPMRRFTQTFVLAAQAPKKYYVHNDIFRYQDMISEEDVDGESRSENDEEQETESTAVIENNQTNNLISQQQPQQIYYPLGGNPVVAPFQPQAPQLNGVVPHEEVTAAVQPTQINNNIPTQGLPLHQQPQPQQQPPVQVQTSAPTLEQLGNNGAPVTNNNSNDVTADVTTNATTLTNDINSTGPHDGNDDLNDDNSNAAKDLGDSVSEVTKPVANEPKTYAHLFKSDNSSSGMSFASAMASNNSNNTRPNNVNSSYASRTNDTRPEQSRTLNNRQAPLRERRTSSANQFNDSHQLFLGNVPHHATEDELKEIFGRFGTVVDLRIHTKQGQKVPGVRAPPHYGFITYEDPESVQNCLSNMPLYYPENSPDGQKLNVEEKKTRLRTDGGNNLGNDRNNDRGDRGDRGLGRTLSGGQRNNGDRDGPRLGLNRGPNSGGMIRSGPTGVGASRTGGPNGGRVPFNRNDRPQGPGPRGNGTTNPNNTGGGSGGGAYGRR